MQSPSGSLQVPPMKDVIRNPLFCRVWIGQMASQLANNILLYLLAILLYQRTGSNAAVSGLFLSYGLPSLLFGAVAGVIVDRLDRRAVLLFSHIIRAVMVIPVMMLSEHLGATYLIIFLYAIVMQLTTPSEAPLIPQFVPKSQLVSANSLFSFTFYTSMAIGFVAAGPVLRLFGREGAYILLFLLFTSAALAIWGLPPQGEGFRSFRRVLQYDPFYIMKRLFQDLEAGVRYVMRSHVLRDAVLLLTGTQITLVLLGTLGPGFADKVLQIDIRDASVVILGPAILGILCGALWIGNRGYRIASRTLISAGVLAAGVTLMLVSAVFAATNWLWFTALPHRVVLSIALALFFLLGVANSFLDVPSNSTLQKEAEGEVRGRVYGILSASVGGAGILPVVAGGVLADIIGVGTVIFMLGVLILLYGILRLRYHPSG